MVDVSIIIPVYNAEPYLRDCLDSVLAQNYQSIEVIMVNDGSTDGSRAIMEKYSRADSRFVCIDQENQGAGGARNAGIRAARGRYILFVDADDELLDGALRELMPLAFEHNLDMVRLGWRRTKLPAWETVNANPVCDRVLDQAELLEYFINHFDDFTYLRVLYRAEIIKANRVCFKTRFCEDILFNMTMVFYCERFYMTSKRHYFYRENETGLCETFLDSYILNTERNMAMVEMMTLPEAFKSNNLTSIQKIGLRQQIIGRAFSRYVWFQNIVYLEFISTKKLSSDMKIAFWGAGKRGVSCIKKMGNSQLRNAVFVDNDKQKQGGELLGYPIVAPSDLLDAKYTGYKHYITSYYVFEFFAQMKDLGLVKSFADMRLDVGENTQYDLQLRAADELYDMICEVENRLRTN